MQAKLLLFLAGLVAGMLVMLALRPSPKPDSTQNAAAATAQAEARVKYLEAEVAKLSKEVSDLQKAAPAAKP